MSKSYISFGFLLGALCASIVFSTLKPGTQVSSSDTRRLKIAHTLPINHPVHAGIEHFAERLEFHSQGRLKLQIYPNGQLGNETQTLEQMQSSTLDLAKVGGATLTSFVPVSKVFSLPYLFRNDEHYWTVLDGTIGQELLEMLATNGEGQPSGFRGVAYYDAGSRNFYTQKRIQHPNDLSGMKIRVQNDPVAIDMIKAMGASPTPISWGELYTALQQGVVDGAENNPPSFVSSRHFEICKQFSLNQHTRVPDVLIIAEKTWNTLSKQEQNWLSQAAEESSIFQRGAWKNGVEEALKTMQEQGVTVNEVDIAPFMKSTEPVRNKYSSGKVREMLQRIQATPSS